MTSTPKSFDDLLEMTISGGDDQSEEVSQRLQDQAQSRAVLYTDVAIRSGMARIQRIHNALGRVEEKIFENIDRLSPQQLMAFHQILTRELGYNVDRVLGKDNGRPAPIQILNYVQQASQTSSTSAVAVAGSGPSQVSRDKVRAFVRGVLDQSRSDDQPTAPLQVVRVK